jgi:Protein of unknown function (DUF2878)
VTAARMIGNVIAFQIGWFACVLGAAYGMPWYGTGAALAIVGWHLFYAPDPRNELILVMIAAGIGALWDTALVALGWIQYDYGTLIPDTAPHWIVALWMLFATTLNVSLAWLKHNVVTAAAFGLIGGPLAYYGAAKLGALVLADQHAALIALAVGWAVLTPVLLRIADHFNGFVPLRGHAVEPRHA